MSVKIYLCILSNGFNKHHRRLQFTHEIEKDQELSFLDSTVIRDKSDNLITNWCTKKTYLGKYLNFLSNPPMQHKISVNNSLVDRGILLSDARFHEKNSKIIAKILEDNNFPKKVIQNYIQKRLRTLRGDSPSNGLKKG